ncbi:MAG: hypothetical protein WCI21_08140, partial [Alphaproteobacteria bacterium]
MLKRLSFLALAAVTGAFAIGAALAPRASASSESSALTEVNAGVDDRQAAQAAQAAQEDCSAPTYQQAALRNASTLQTLSWSPFGRAERGWAIYEEHVARDIGAACQPGTPGFAAALARWQQDHRLPANGEATVQTLSLMKASWQEARPYV